MSFSSSEYKNIHHARRHAEHSRGLLQWGAVDWNPDDGRSAIERAAIGKHGLRRRASLRHSHKRNCARRRQESAERALVRFFTFVL